MEDAIFFLELILSPGRGGRTLTDKVGDARRLAKGCKSQILVSLSVFTTKRHNF